MDFKEFCQTVVKDIRSYLPESFAGAKVELYPLVKNNGLRSMCLAIYREGDLECPVVELEPFFEAYRNGAAMHELLHHISRISLQAEDDATPGLEQIDFEDLQDRIIPRLVNKAWNSASLSKVPFTEMADLAVTYHYLLEVGRGRCVSTEVGYGLLEKLNLTMDELHKTAIRNMTRLFPSTFMGMTQMANMLSGGIMPAMSPEEERYFILSNQQHKYGATAVLDKDIMKEVIKKVGKDFLIVPSTLHEMFIVPRREEKAYFETLLRRSNAADTMPQDRLSDRIYRYTPEDGLIIV